MKIKNIYSEKFKKHKVELNDEAVFKSMGQIFRKGFIVEGGIDEVDGVEKEYLIVKVYKDME